jgi:hypothetical protein
MADKPDITRRTFLGALCGGGFGFLSVDADRDSAETAIGKIAGGATAGAIAGAVSAGGDKIHGKIVQPPSREEIARADEENSRKWWHFLQNRAKERYDRQRDGGDKHTR